MVTQWHLSMVQKHRLSQCMKRPVAHSLNSTWFWIELPENCCEPLKFIMKYICIQFCEWPGHGRPFHALLSWRFQQYKYISNMIVLVLIYDIFASWKYLFLVKCNRWLLNQIRSINFDVTGDVFVTLCLYDIKKTCLMPGVGSIDPLHPALV